MIFPADSTPVRVATKPAIHQLLLAVFGPWVVNLYIYFHQVPLFKKVWSCTTIPAHVLAAWLYCEGVQQLNVCFNGLHPIMLCQLRLVSILYRLCIVINCIMSPARYRFLYVFVPKFVLYLFRMDTPFIIRGLSIAV